MNCRNCVAWTAVLALCCWAAALRPGNRRRRPRNRPMAPRRNKGRTRPC